MTLNLQIVLAIIGVIVVFLIYLISRWQDRAQHNAQTSMKAPVAEPHNLDMHNFAGEHPGPAAPDQDQDQEMLAGVQQRDSIADADADADANDFPRRRREGFAQLSQIDYWVKITGTRDVGRETVLALYRDDAANFSKAHGIHGFKMPDQEWCDVVSEAEDSRFTDLVMTIQLADRNGAISEREMTRFSALVSKLAKGTGREFFFMTPIENSFAQADAIAEFVRRFDSVFAVNLHPQESECFLGPVIDRYAQQMGLEPNDNHHYSRFKFINKSKVALYNLASLNDTARFDFADLKSCNPDGLTFFTKPAVNRSPGAVFAEMVDTALVLASRMKGKVTLADDDKDLTQEIIDATRKSIERVAAEMERAGIPAGSAEAARIF